jgi:hypothetical protein
MDDYCIYLFSSLLFHRSLPHRILDICIDGFAFFHFFIGLICSVRKFIQKDILLAGEVGGCARTSYIVVVASCLVLYVFTLVARSQARIFVSWIL